MIQVASQVRYDWTLLAPILAESHVSVPEAPAPPRFRPGAAPWTVPAVVGPNGLGLVLGV